MPEFDYKVVSRDEYKSGRLQADSLLTAQTTLSEQGLTIVSLRQRRPLEMGFLSGIWKNLETELTEQMSISEKILFTSQLASMVKAGLPLVDALSTFIDQKSYSGSARIVNKIIAEVQSGVKLSEALSRFGAVFPPAYRAVVKAGETSGTLGDSLSYLGIQLRRENDLANRVKSALIYPAVVVTAMVGVMVFISVSVVPKILLFAQSSGQKLPGYTLTLVNVVTFATHYWYLVVFMLILSILVFVAFARSKSGGLWLGKLSLRLPVVGILVARYNQARFARVLGGFYSYGVDIISSFEILAESLDNPLYRLACRRINNRLVSGQTLSEAVGAERELFPSIMSRLIKGAEKTGDLGNTLDKLAHFYEEELDVALKNILALIEPLLVFVLGFGVLALALVVVVPIYKITSTIK